MFIMAIMSKCEAKFPASLGKAQKAKKKANMNRVVFFFSRKLLDVTDSIR